MSSISFEKALSIALEQHQAGQFARAEGLYLEILRQDPANVDALHLLGVLAHQGKKPDIAIELISTAIRRRPDVALFHYNLAESYVAVGRQVEAADSYRRAIELKKDYFEAYTNLGNVLMGLRRFADAETASREAIRLNPKAPNPLNNLGNALRGLGRANEAIDVYGQAIALRSDFAEAVNNLAMCLCSVNRLDEGVDQFRKAIALAPASADLYNNLGTVLATLGRTEEAGEAFQTAIDITPKHAEANNNLGAVFRTLNQPAQAIEHFRNATKLRPEFAEAHTNLAATLADSGLKSEALESVEAALKLRPDFHNDHFLRGIILRDLSRYDEAVEEFDRALELQPQNHGALTALGYARLERGELDEAMAALSQSLQLRPDPQTHSNVLLTASYHPGYSPLDILKLHREWGTVHETPLMPRWLPHPNDRSPGRRLRIGYVSPDFRGHSVANFLEPVLEHHDHDHFDIFAYAHIVLTDIHTWRLRARIDQWRETAGKSPDQVAAMIRDDQIDILVELAGHTANNSLTTFARKPAPIQINMIGFPSTTGLVAMDYRVTDDRCDPEGVTDEFNSEKLIRLPHTFWAYQPPYGAPDISPLPADRTGSLTFASVNNFTKVTPHVQSLWAQLLLAVPNSRLILQTTALASEYTRKVVTHRFAELGVDADRLDFRRAIGFRDFLKFLTDDCDLTLDPFPFNGGTTTCHSLWMGVPVMTLAGDRHASRMGLSMMTAIGLPEFVAHTPEEFVEIGRTLAADLSHLRSVRAGMRERLKASPLLDGAGYTRDLEAAYRKVWTDWCATPAAT